MRAAVCYTACVERKVRTKIRRFNAMTANKFFAAACGTSDPAQTPRLRRTGSRSCLRLGRSDVTPPARFLCVERTAERDRRPDHKERFLRRADGLCSLCAEKLFIQRCGRLLRCGKHGFGGNRTRRFVLHHLPRRGNFFGGRG